MMKRIIIVCVLTVVFSRGGYAETLQGKHVHPYQIIDITEVFKVLPMFFQQNQDTTLETWKEKRSLWGEAEALLYEFHHYNLDVPPHHTDGWSNFVEAEWPFMGLVYTGLALCNLVDTYPELTEQALGEVQWVLQAIQTPAVSGFMTSHFGEPFPSEFPIQQTSVFVHGHFLYLALRYRETFQHHEFDDIIHHVASALHRNFLDDPIQASYADMWYLSDNLPALAALRRYDAVFQTSLSHQPVKTFLHEVRTSYLDEYSGLLCTYVIPQSKQQASRSRGIGVMYALIFLPDVDPSFAQEQWHQAKQHLIRTLSDILKANAHIVPFADYLSQFGADLYVSLEHAEHPGMSDGEKNFADIDSGPVILGAGTSASGFALAAAKRMGDVPIADGLEHFAILMGNPTWIENRLYYLNMFHPVGQAIIFFGKTLNINVSAK